MLTYYDELWVNCGVIKRGWEGKTNGVVHILHEVIRNILILVGEFYK